MDFANIDYMLTVNRLTPIVAIGLILVAIFSRKYITKDCVSSSIMHLKIVFWIMLIWADWGSAVFHPSKQTVLARCLELVILWLVILLIKNYSRIFRQLKQALNDALAKLEALTKLYQQLQSNYQILADENRALKKLLHEEINRGNNNENKQCR